MWPWLVKLLAGLSLKAAAEKLRLPFALETAYRLRRGLRHGFGSYYFALIKDENRVAAEMGNSPAMVHRHYRAMIGNADCVKFWAISPPEKASAPTTIPATTPHENFAAN